MEVTVPDNEYDIVVVGGGMVGASFALALSQAVSQQNLTVLVVEATAPNNNLAQQTSFDARSTALSFGSRQIFQKMELWQELGNSVTAIHDIEVSDKGRFGSTKLTREEQGVEALGYVVENAALGTVLNDRLRSSESIGFMAPASIEKVTPKQSGMELILNSNDQQTTVNAALVVLAEGGRSPICNQLGIQQFKENYDQFAIIANIAFENAHQNTAYERFTDSGPIAILPLQVFEGENRCSLVWTLGEEESRQMMQTDEVACIAKLQSIIGNRLGTITQLGTKFCYPLSLSIAKEQVRPGLVLMGNVAHTLHPVAGQGLNLALRDIEALVSSITNALANDCSPGSMKTLQSYVEKQDFDQQKAIKFTDSLVKLFSSDSQSKVIARKLGLLSLELLPSARKRFAEQAMGLTAK